MADFNAMFMHPLTQLGARMMLGSDPRREGLGGIGFGLMQTQRAMQDQARYEDEQARYQAEQARAKQLADMQMQMYQAKLGAQQQATQATEDLAAQYPEHAPAIRAGLGSAVVGSQLAKPKVSSAMRIYREAGGQEGTGKPFGQWYAEDYKGGGPNIQIGGEMGGIPQAMARVADPQSPTGTRLVAEPGAPKKKISEADLKNQSIARENVQLISEVQAEMLDDQGNAIPEKLAESRIPGTPLYGKLQTIAQNETYLKSGAAATASETAITKGGIQPSALDVIMGATGMSGTAPDKLQRSRAYAESRSGQPQADTQGWSIIEVK